MAGPFETRRVSTFINRVETSARRLKTNIDAIIDKYNKPFPDDDEINLYTMTITKDRGCFRRMKRPIKLGAAQLKSTYRKEELLQRQLSSLKCPMDPNVSMAITRHYVSHISNSRASRDEPSDAETITSDSSDEDADSSDEDADSSDEDADGNGGDADGSDEDENVAEEDDNVANEEEVLERSAVDHVDKYAALNGISHHKQNITYSQKDMSMTASNSCHETSFNNSSALNNLSRVSSQSQKQNASQNILNRSLCGSQNKQPEHSLNTAFENRLSYKTRKRDIFVSDRRLRSDDSKLRFLNNLQRTESTVCRGQRKEQSPRKSSTTYNVDSTFLLQDCKRLSSDRCLRSRDPDSRMSRDILPEQKLDSKTFISRHSSSDRQDAPFVSLRPLVRSLGSHDLLASHQKLESPASCHSVHNKSKGVLSTQMSIARNEQRNEHNVYQTGPKKCSMVGRGPQNNSTPPPGKMKSIEESLESPRTSAQAKSIPDSKFKSPQGIRIKRIIPTPVKDGNLSYPQPRTTGLLDLPKKVARSSPAVITTSFFNSNARSCKLQTETSKHIGNHSTLLNDVSFSSSDEDIQDDVLRNCSLLLDSIIIPSTQAGGPSTASNKLSVSPAQLNATNSPTDTSLTSSLRHLYIHPQVKSSQAQSQRGHTLSSPVSEQQKNMKALLPRTAQQSSHGNVTSGSYNGSAVRTKKAPGKTYKNWSNVSTSSYQYGQSSSQLSGFDQRKWITAASEITRQTERPTYGRLKRKLSGSSTSGYFTESSASPQFAQSCYNTSAVDNTLAINSTVILSAVPKVSGSHVTGQSTLLQPRHAKTRCLQLKSASQNEISETDHHNHNGPAIGQIKSSTIFCENMDKKFVVEKKTLKSPSKACFHIGNEIVNRSLQFVPGNLCRLCPTHASRQDNNSRQDQRVYEWVKASSNTTEARTAAHCPSCPTTITQYYLNHSCRHICAICNHQSRGAVAEPRCQTLCRCTIPGISNHAPTAQQFLPCSVIARPLRCDHHCTCHSAFSVNQPTEKIQSPAVSCCQYQNCNTSSLLHKEETCYGRHSKCNTLDKRAQKVWSEIQAERSDMEAEEGHWDSTVLDKSVSDSLSSSCRSDLDPEAINIHDHSSRLLMPKISSFLKSSLEKKLAGDFITRSFVEAHSPMPKIEAPKHPLLGGASRSNTQNTMFPNSYINQFSPTNPTRIDSDAPSSKPMKQKSTSLALHESFNTPVTQGLGSNHSLTFCTYSSGKHSLEAIQNPSQRNPTAVNSGSHSTFSVNATVSIATKHLTSRQGRTRISSNGNTNSLDNLNGRSKHGTRTLPGYRASTPVRGQLKMSDLSLDQTFSTIGALYISDDEDCRESSMIAEVDTLVQYVNFGDDVDLL